MILIEYKIGIFDLIALLISVFALTATLRKKEFGKFVFIKINNPNQGNDVWLKVIKSEIYELTFKIISNSVIDGRIKLEYIDGEQTVICFPANSGKNFYLTSLKPGEKIKVSNFNFNKIEIIFKDKYKQTLYRDSITKRNHVNFLNLTFVGS